jgi:hypothetical protein
MREVYEINPVIFPVKLFLMTGEPGVFTADGFIYMSDKTVPSEETETGLVLSRPVKRLSDGMNGFMMVVTTALDEHEIVHECVHAAEEMFSYIGETNPGHETRAYLTQFLMKSVMQAIKSERDSENNKN